MLKSIYNIRIRIQANNLDLLDANNEFANIIKDTTIGNIYGKEFEATAQTMLSEYKSLFNKINDLKVDPYLIKDLNSKKDTKMEIDCFVVGKYDCFQTFSDMFIHKYVPFPPSNRLNNHSLIVEVKLRSKEVKIFLESNLSPLQLSGVGLIFFDLCYFNDFTHDRLVKAIVFNGGNLYKEY